MTSSALLLQTALEIAAGSSGSSGSSGADDLPLVAALLRRAVAAAAGPEGADEQASKAVTIGASSSPQATAATAAPRLKRAYVRKAPVRSRRPKGVASLAEMMAQLEITPSHADSVRYGTRVAALYRRHTTIPAPKYAGVKMYPAEWLRGTLASVALGGVEA